MKKLIFIVALLIISCSNQESFEFAEGKILNIEKGAKTGSFEFIDEEFTTAQRDSIYYVRAIEEPIETIASDPLGCEYDENGKCIKTKICRLGHKKHNECLAPSEHRAWSSPIFVNYSS